MTVRKSIIAIALLASTSVYAEEKDSYGLWDFMLDLSEISSANTNKFIATHGEQYRIKDNKIYNGSARQYEISKNYPHQNQ